MENLVLKYELAKLQKGPSEIDYKLDNEIDKILFRDQISVLSDLTYQFCSNNCINDIDTSKYEKI